MELKRQIRSYTPVVPFEMHARFHIKMGLVYIGFQIDPNGPKTIPFGAAHSYSYLYGLNKRVSARGLILDRKGHLRQPLFPGFFFFAVHYSYPKFKTHSWISKVLLLVFTHDVTKIQTTKLSILLRFYFHGLLEQLKTNFQTNFRFKRVLGFLIEYA